MKGKLLVSSVICLASTLGLVSLLVPGPVTITFTTTPPVTLTQPQAFTLTRPLQTTLPPLYVCFWVIGGGAECETPVGVSGRPVGSYTVTVSEVQTWTSFSWFPAGSYVVRCLTQTIAGGGYTYTYSTSICVQVAGAEVTETVSPIVTTSVTTSSMTSSLISTGYMTKQMPPVSTGSAYQEGAVALAVVLAVSLLTAVLVCRKNENKTL